MECTRSESFFLQLGRRQELNQFGHIFFAQGGTLALGLRCALLVANWVLHSDVMGGLEGISLDINSEVFVYLVCAVSMMCLSR